MPGGVAVAAAPATVAGTGTDAGTGAPAPRRSSLGRNASKAFAVQTVGAATNFLTQSLLARTLGAVGFGRYSFALNLTQLVAVPTDLGGSSSAMRFVPQYRAQDERALLRGFVRVSQLVPLVVGSIAAVITAVVVGAVNTEPTVVNTVIVAAVGLPLFQLTLVQVSILRSIGRVMLAFIPTLVVQPLILGVGVLALPHRSVVTYAWITLGALVIVSAFQYAAIARWMRGLSRVPAQHHYREWAQVSLPLDLINVIQLVFQRADIVAVALILGPKSAGIYTIANRLAVVTASLQKAVVTMVAPNMSRLHYSGRTAEVEAVVLRGLRLVFWPALAVTVALAAAGTEVLSLISPEYRAGYAAVVVYSIGQLISVSTGPVGWLAAIVGEQRAAARVNAISALIALVAYAALIPTIGIVGAATGNAVGVAYRNYGMLRISHRRGYRISLARALMSGRRPARAESGAHR